MNPPDVHLELLPSLQSLAALIAVIETGSFSKAAARLAVSQPTISVQIAKLEKSAGVSLLIRKPRLEPTDSGREMFQRAKAILGQLTELRASLGEIRGAAVGRLRLGFSSPALAMPLLEKYLEGFPGVSVETSLGNSRGLLHDIRDCRLDAAVCTLARPVSDLECRLIARQKLCVWLPRRHPMASNAQISLRQAGGAILVGREEGSMTRYVFELACARAGISPAYRLTVGSREALREAVAAGLGAGVVFEGESGHDSRLCAVPIAHTPLHAGLYVVHLRELSALPIVKALLDTAARLAEALPDRPRRRARQPVASN